MSATIADQLGVLPLVSTVLRVDFDLLDAETSFEQAQLILERWAGNKALDFSEAIDWSKSSTKIESANLFFDFASADDTFTFFLSHKEAGNGPVARDWMTEVCIAKSDDQVRFATRLSIRQPRNAPQPAQRAPKFISELVDRIGARDTLLLQSKPLEFHGGNFEDFDSLLLSAKRSLPILAISEDQDAVTSHVDSARLASLLCGVSHVAVLNPVASWMLTEKYGKERSTFRGAVRCYNPGFSSSADPFQHKLWLSESISRSNAFRSNGFLNLCVSHIFAVTTAQFAPYPFTTPSALKRKESEQPVSVLTNPAAIAQEKLILDEVTELTERVPALAEAPIGEQGPPPESAPDRIERRSSEDRRAADRTAPEIGGLVEDKISSDLQAKEYEIARLEKELLEARDETAQRSQEVALLMPFKQEAADLKDEVNLLSGKYDSKASPIVRDFWDGFNIFFDAAKNLTAQATRADKQDIELESIRTAMEESNQRISQLEGKLVHKERQLESLKEDRVGGPIGLTLFPNTWGEFLKGAQAVLTCVRLPKLPHSKLRDCPYSESIAKQILQLLQILDQIGLATGPDGRLSADGLKIQQQYFVGENAWFSDESATNKRAFESQLTFPSPVDDGKRLFCPWHGKINQQQFRIHFDWPLAQGQKSICVAYIGPKVTKH